MLLGRQYFYPCDAAVEVVLCVVSDSIGGVFIELKGILIGEAKHGFAAEFDWLWVFPRAVVDVLIVEVVLLHR